MSFRHLDHYAAIPSRVTGHPPVARLSGTVLLSLGAATLPVAAWPQLGILAAVVTVLAVAARVPLTVMIRRVAWPLAFVVLASVLVLVLVPGEPLRSLGPVTITSEGLARFGTITMRATVALGAAVLLVSTTTFPELLHALRQLRLPRVVIVALSLGYRLLYILVDEIERLERAATSRNAGPGIARRHRLLTGISAAALSRSVARADRTWRAMLARGYHGDILPLHEAPVSATTMAGLATLMAVVVTVVLWARL
jgi:cobalt ECF transporter T component CbiQ